MSEELKRSLPQFFFEVGYGACFAEALIQNGNLPFKLTDALVERAWEIAAEAHDDPIEFDEYLAQATDLATFRAQNAELRRIIDTLLPSNLGGVPKHMEDTFVFPVDITAGEIRAALNALAQVAK